MEKFNKKILILILIGALFAIFLFYFMNENDEEYIDINEVYNVKEENLEEQIEINLIKIHIIGEIKNPGIIEITEGSRIADAIEKAGGVTKEADVSKVNLAYLLQDGQKVYIPNKNDEEIEYIEDTAGNNVIVEDKTSKKESKININTATQTELETLSGIGPSTALKIINYRKENGKFNSIDEIMNVSGIGEAKYESIKDYICVK